MRCTLFYPPTPCKPVSDVAQFVSRCEVAGFDGVGILDSQMLERDVFVSMAMAAQATSHIRICSAVLNPVTRHVSVITSGYGQGDARVCANSKKPAVG